jgi:hypothetical protein
MSRGFNGNSLNVGRYGVAQLRKHAKLVHSGTFATFCSCTSLRNFIFLLFNWVAFFLQLCSFHSHLMLYTHLISCVATGGPVWRAQFDGVYVGEVRHRQGVHLPAAGIAQTDRNVNSRYEAPGAHQAGAGVCEDRMAPPHPLRGTRHLLSTARKTGFCDPRCEDCHHTRGMKSCKYINESFFGMF